MLVCQLKDYLVALGGGTLGKAFGGGTLGKALPGGEALIVVDAVLDGTFDFFFSFQPDAIGEVSSSPKITYL